MSGTMAFTLGGIVGVIGLCGLIGAGEAETGSLYYAGLLVFLGAVVYDLSLIKRHFDRAERAGAGPGH